MTQFNAWSVKTWKKAIITVMETLPPGTALTREQIAALAVDFLLQTGVPKDAYDANKDFEN
jgi:hypothetical protein